MQLKHPALKTNFALSILGDGQLARLLCLEARQAGLNCVALSLSPEDSPLKDLAQLVPAQSWQDEVAIQNVIAAGDAIILENEFIPAELLKKFDKPCYPNIASYQQVDTKLKQKYLAQACDVKVPKYQVIEQAQHVTELTPPFILKAIRGGYDGYGNYLVKTTEQLAKAKDFVAKAGTCLAEEVLDFECEIAIMVARNEEKTVHWPAAETVQQNHICHFVLSPPRLSSEVIQKAQDIACRLIEKMSGIGVFGIELFVLPDGEIVFNEIAPRPHNSAHFTIDACQISQFGNLLRLATGQEILKPQTHSLACGMLNLLGTKQGHAIFQGHSDFHQQGHLHLYGKTQSRLGRKMGHYTLTGDNVAVIFQKLTQLKEQYQL